MIQPRNRFNPVRESMFLKEPHYPSWRMQGVVGLNILAGKVNVDHGGIDALVPEDYLQLTDHSRSAYVTRRERVPQSVGPCFGPADLSFSE